MTCRTVTGNGNGMQVISLGWGVQSFALAAMSALGVLPLVDVAIHADTTHERAETYAFAKRWTPWLEERGVRVVTVQAVRTGVVEQWHVKGVMIPAFTTYSTDIYVDGGDYGWDDDGEEFFVPDGTKILLQRAGDLSGMLRRQCTGDWKIAPIRRWLRTEGIKPKPGAVEMWLGITLDESARMKQADVKYIVNRFPFIEMFDSPWYRWQAVRWLQGQGLEVPLKSSCIICTYQDQSTWRERKLADNGDWEKAVVVDETIRHKRPGYVCYLHRECIPLSEVDFRSERDHGQLSLWDEECEGYCDL